MIEHEPTDDSRGESHHPEAEQNANLQAQCEPELQAFLAEHTAAVGELYALCEARYIEHGHREVTEHDRAVIKFYPYQEKEGWHVEWRLVCEEYEQEKFFLLECWEVAHDGSRGSNARVELNARTAEVYKTEYKLDAAGQPIDIKMPEWPLQLLPWQTRNFTYAFDATSPVAPVAGVNNN